LKVSGKFRTRLHIVESNWLVGEIVDAVVTDASDQLIMMYDGAIVPCVGVSGSDLDGLDVEVTGEMQQSKYGTQLKAKHFKLKMDEEAIYKRILFGGFISFVGEKTAGEIWNKWGKEYRSHMIASELMKVKGIGATKAVDIELSWLDTKTNIDSIILSLRLGLAAHIARRAIERWGEDTHRVLTEHPYRIIEIDGAGWATAEKLAEEVDADPQSYDRYVYATEYVLKNAAASGHTWQTEKQLLKELQKIIKEFSADRWRQALNSQPYERIVEHKDGFTTSRMMEVVNTITKRILSISQSAEPLKFLDEKPEYVDDTQWEVVRHVMNAGVTCLTGGAGTGKTTALRALVEAAGAAGYAVTLMAPTGMAAARMEDVTQLGASTIHRGIGLRPGTYWSESGNEINAHICVVDEGSMIDVSLASYLLRAIQNGTHVLFSGDAFQLPPVGPGEFFRDLITSNVVTTVKLTTVYRSGIDGITINANKMRKMKNRGQFDYTLPGISLMNAGSIKAMVKNIEKGTIVLAGFRREVSEANNLLQAKFNREPRHKLNKYLTLSLGDPVRVTKNDYDLEVFNGQRGIVKFVESSVGPEEPAVVVEMTDGREVAFTKSESRILVLAYASTIHSSQGNEWDNVAVIVPWSNNKFVVKNFITASLLYTAVTRPKKHLTIIQLHENAMKIYESARAFDRRQTMLKEKLIKEKDTQLEF